VPFYLTPIAYFQKNNLEHNMLFHSSLTLLVLPLVFSIGFFAWLIKEHEALEGGR